MRCCPKCRNVPNERGIPWDEREIKEESYLEFRTQPMIEAALREARQEAAQEAPQPERKEQQDAAVKLKGFIQHDSRGTEHTYKNGIPVPGQYKI